MKRRKFVWLMGAGTMLPMTIASCQGNNNPTNTGAANTSTEILANTSSDGFQVVGTVAELQGNGQLLVDAPGVGKVLVIPDPANPDRAIAVNPTCTHEGCTVDWAADQTEFVCPCHDAKFGPNGELVEGPAKEPLGTYPTEIQGDEVRVKLA